MNFENEKTIILQNFEYDLRNDTIIFFRRFYTTNTYLHSHIEIYIFIVTSKLTLFDQ